MLGACTVETVNVYEHTHHVHTGRYHTTPHCSWQLYDPRITPWANEQLRKEYTPQQLERMGFQNQWTCVENH
jgi:hypothetical protein